MSDEGDKTCPLCAEEMDLTDQQLKPCRCGYEVCVWCWHHIMEMAEKDDTEGRCPACRTPYDKEKIVGTAEKCERLVAEINMEKKQKTQKTKIKPADIRKQQLTSVRVIQRNLVYIVGLPLNLADEELLQRREYFGQYGKVLKVSISRTSAGTIQQFANNTCSVYITYGKEEEAVRCIQSVHGFILDGRSLRACFGTTKYCHAWLRNVPCCNPDCLYLHEIGSQEDSFTKDEIISAYTRSRVQQITGCTNNMQRRSGNMLPPPLDDYCSNGPAVTTKPTIKSSSNNPTSSTKISPPTSSSGRSGALPAAASWGARASNCSQSAGSLVCSNGPTKHNSEVTSAAQAAVIGSIQAATLPTDVGKKHLLDEELDYRQTKSKSDMLDTMKQHVGVNSQLNVAEVSASSGTSSVKSTSLSTRVQAADSYVRESGDSNIFVEEQLSSPGSSNPDESIQQLCSDMSFFNIDKRLNDEHTEGVKPNVLSLDNFLPSGAQGLQWDDSESLQQHLNSASVIAPESAVDSLYPSPDTDSALNVPMPAVQNISPETEDDFDNQRLRDAIVVNQMTMPTSSPHNLFSHLRGPLQHVDPAAVVNYSVNPPTVHRTPEESLADASGLSGASNGFLENYFSHGSGQNNTSLLLNGGPVNQVIGRFDSRLPNGNSRPDLDIGESSIISNILDLDSWDESLTSPQNLAKLLGEAEKQEGSFNLSNSWRGQMSNQSRFSFARQEESRNHLYDYSSPASSIGPVTNNNSFGQAFVDTRDPFLDNLTNSLGYSQRSLEPSDNNFAIPNKISSSRSHISAPPGFTAPSRPPPPGFSSYDRSDQSFDFKSGNQLFESSLLRNPYQGLPSGNMSSANDIEFIDPAILAVGKGRLPSATNNSTMDMRPNFHVQTPAFDNESRLQLLMQRSLSPHQNLRYTDFRDNFSPSSDAFGVPSRHMEQSQAGNMPPFNQFSLQQGRNNIGSNGHWDGWSDIPSNEMGIAELLRNDRLGFNKFGVTNSGDMYNRSFRM